MSSTRISPTSPAKTITRSNTSASTTVQLQLRRSISVENENGAATLALLAALVKNSNCVSNVVQEAGPGIKSSGLNSSNLSAEKECINYPIINQQHVETVVLSTPSQSSIATIATATTIVNNNNNNSICTVNSVAKSSSISQNLHHQIPSDILDDLASRFIINTPVDERQNLIRICFQIELAHWFYLDFFCANEEKKLIPCGLKQFALHLFQHIPFLRNNLSGIDKILEDWKEYKLSVPTYGAILVSEDLKSVLLVQSYWAKSSWGFPKGKINEHEDPVHCATREVYEETGFDITNMIKPDHYIECVINYQYTRLYIIRNVSISTSFSPRTRKEIKCCEWFPLDSLPTNKNDPNCKSQLGINANSFFMIIPFMKRLKKWINDNRSGIERKYSSSSPITTFNNNNGCGNYYGNNSSGNYNSNGLVNKQHSSAKKQINIVDNKKNGNCPSNNLNINNNINNNVIINNNVNSNNSNQNKGTTNNNSNNNNNQKNKRQRHKSMGDIDGINLKLNFIKNNNSNNNGNNNRVQQQQSNGYDNNKMQNNHTTPKNNCNGKDNSDSNKKCFFEQNSKYANKHNNLKRQLFSCVSTDGSTNITDKITANNNINSNSNNNHNNIINNNNNNNINKKDKDKNLQNYNNLNNNNIKNCANNNMNNVRSRTKSLGQNNNNNNNQSSNAGNGVQRKNSNENKDGGNMRKKSHNNLQQQQHQQSHQQQQSNQHLQAQQNDKNKNGQTQFNNNNNNTNTNIIIDKKPINHHNYLINNCTTQQRQFLKLKQQHEQLRAEEEKNQINSQHIVTDNIKFNPNFDSWTNFSFTKNFIANVFC